jgi:apolipoprotein N-acyltransferase
MSLRNWSAYFRPHPSYETPTLFRLVFAAVSGAALSLSYTGLYLSVYSWVCIGVLLVVIFGAPPRTAFLCGLVHGLAFCLSSVPWIATVLAVHGGLSRAGGWGVLLLIASVWGLLTGTFAWAVQRLATRSVVLACIGAPFLWVTFEFIRAHLPEISFPWNLLGYPASSNLALLQITTVTGIDGLSFLVAAFNALLAWADIGPTPAPKQRLFVLGGTVLAIVAVMFGGQRLVPKVSAHHYARAVQTDFPELDTYEPNWLQTHTSDLNEVERLSLKPASPEPDLLIWPEAPAPFSFEDPNFAELASTLAIRFHHPFLAGVVEFKQAPSTNGDAHNAVVPYNSAILLDAQGQRVFTYDKIHLVPFGEYEPFPLIHAVVASVSGEVGGFRKGTTYSVGHLPNNYSFGTFICYEAIYPGEVRHFAANGAQLYINISNDGWFGRSAAAEQHLRMARVRAVENRRWLLRVTNSGITASVDPYGRISRGLPRDVRGSTDLPYDFRTDETIYTRFGDWFAWLCVIVSVILLATTFTKGNTAGDELLMPIQTPKSLVAANQSLSHTYTASPNSQK